MRAGNLAAYSHQELPFERLVEVLNRARSLSRHPLFQVMLVLQNNAELGLELSGLSVGFEAVATASAKFDLSLSLVERRGSDGSPAGIVDTSYANDLFDRSSVEAIAGRLVRLLEGAVADPERAIGRLDILGADERHTHLREWNATARALPRATLPELFAAQVARTRCGRGSVEGRAADIFPLAGIVVVSHGRFARERRNLPLMGRDSPLHAMAYDNYGTLIALAKTLADNAEDTG